MTQTKPMKGAKDEPPAKPWLNIDKSDVTPTRVKLRTSRVDCSTPAGVSQLPGEVVTVAAWEARRMIDTKLADPACMVRLKKLRSINVIGGGGEGLTLVQNAGDLVETNEADAAALVARGEAEYVKGR